ncbi:hypothetical protein V8F20_008959 [Naviculisporaceae sp. PSN 640]
MRVILYAQLMVRCLASFVTDIGAFHCLYRPQPRRNISYSFTLTLDFMVLRRLSLGLVSEVHGCFSPFSVRWLFLLVTSVTSWVCINTSLLSMNMNMDMHTSLYICLRSNTVVNQWSFGKSRRLLRIPFM